MKLESSREEKVHAPSFRLCHPMNTGNTGLVWFLNNFAWYFFSRSYWSIVLSPMISNFLNFAANFAARNLWPVLAWRLCLWPQGQVFSDGKITMPWRQMNFRKFFCPIYKHFIIQWGEDKHCLWYSPFSNFYKYHFSLWFVVILSYELYHQH